MLELLRRNWWVFALRGIIAIAFGVLAFAQPAITLQVLVLFVAAYLIADGVSLLVSYIRGEPQARRAGWTVAAIGVLGIVAGIAAFFWPEITALWLLALVAFWAIFVGILQLIAAIRLRREIEGELWLALGGIIAIAFGVYLIVNPGDGLVSLVWLVGFWAVAFGVINLVLAWRLRNLRRDTSDTRGAATAT
jgi:uncharacterized membrane protein HdeD (DUF308 family)